MSLPLGTKSADLSGPSSRLASRSRLARSLDRWRLGQRLAQRAMRRRIAQVSDEQLHQAAQKRIGAFELVLEDAAADDHDLGVLDRGRGGGTRTAVDDGHLAENAAGPDPEERDALAVDDLVELDQPFLDQIGAAAGTPFAEDLRALCEE